MEQILVVAHLVLVSPDLGGLAARVPAAVRWGLKYPELNWDRLLPLAPIPLLVLWSGARLFRALRSDATYAPCLWSVALFLLGYVGLLAGIWPYLVPYAVTIHEAAAAPSSQAFLLAGTCSCCP